MTILDSLLAISAYPIPMRTVEAYATKRGLEITDDMEEDMYAGRGYRLATADLMLWLYFAPNVSQGGQSYSLTDAQRAEFRRRALTIYDELGEGDVMNAGVRYGYKGENL